MKVKHDLENRSYEKGKNINDGVRLEGSEGCDHQYTTRAHNMYKSDT